MITADDNNIHSLLYETLQSEFFIKKLIDTYRFAADCNGNDSIYAVSDKTIIEKLKFARIIN